MAQVNLRVDDATKAKAETICAAMGLNMSTAINIFLKKLVNEQRIPFEVSLDPFYSRENMARLKKAVRDLDEGKGSIHEVI